LAQSPVFRVTLPWLGVIAAMTARLNLEGLRNYVRVPYAQAGYPGGLDDDEVVSLGVLLGLGAAVFVGFSAVVLLGVWWVWIGVMGLPLGFLILVSSLKSQASARELKILQAMPYLLDLMVLMLRSGTSLRIALSRVVEDYRYHPIGVELGQVLAEMDVGTSRADAFRRLAERLKIPDVTSLADVIVQSEELGWPLAETLERLADRLSAERVLRAQSKAGAAGVLVMLPSTMVLAAAVLLLFGPIIVRALRAGSLVQ
jgi:tight adherence protein C